MADSSADTAKPKRRRGPGRPFQKGRSGNPGGRPKTAASIREFLDEVVSAKLTTGEIIQSQRRQAIMQSLYLVATDRRHRDCMRAMELILAYDMGRPRERVEVSGPDGGPMEHMDVRGRTTGELRKRLAELEARAAARGKEAGG